MYRRPNFKNLTKYQISVFYEQDLLMKKENISVPLPSKFLFSFVVSFLLIYSSTSK